MKLSTIKFRREKTTRSPYVKHEKSRWAYKYPEWVTNRQRPPEAIRASCRANLLAVFPKMPLVFPPTIVG